MKKYTNLLFIEKFKNINFPNYENFLDANLDYSDFINKLTSVINEIAPLKTKKVKCNSQDWFDGEVAEKIAIRDKLFKKFKKSRLQIDKDLYRNARNDVESLLRSKKKSYFENKLKENIGKPKDLWKALKDLGLPNKGSPSKTTNFCIKDNGSLIFKPMDISNVFKRYFSQIAENLLLKLAVASNKFNINSVGEYYKSLNIKNKFKFSLVTDETILGILIKLDVTKAKGIDNIAAVFLKDGTGMLSTHIAKLCNLSITTAAFQDDCKIAKLIPIYTKGSKSDPKNYRPISILPLISKIFEKLIHDQTQSFLDDNNILYDFQSGFRKNYSTDSCFSFLTDKISTGFDSGLFTGMILIDPQKAFDTIDHELLLEKMVFLGFSIEVINWFRLYISNRNFEVNISKAFSDCGKVTCGVPQGSILGPLLFLLYTNDMPQALSCDLLLYADDSCLIFQNKNEKVLNQNFCNLCDWFVDNKLSIHFGEDKTKCIL